MKQTTFNISFYCRNCRVNRDGTAPVEMSIVIAGRRCLLSLPRKEKPSDFLRQVNAKKDNDLKIYLDAIRHKVREIETEMLLRDIPLTASLLRDYFRSGGVQNYSVKDLFEVSPSSSCSSSYKATGPRCHNLVDSSANRAYSFDAYASFIASTIEMFLCSDNIVASQLIFDGSNRYRLS